ncbi:MULTISPECIES: hypothetical protein [unclassified Pseudoclavibacter]|uniref:hypothetical protein n=1 Tax=unclassified Pseudoclavibacter TaxID=2615177 RepID=UPI001BAA3D08|nr:hypothetical protein [Pseudoclavibacter sp. Marseille-Q4354]MBS3177749.1 hypothetical protein [Pseudoclavibacter sp. Marseille-Q4354]
MDEIDWPQELHNRDRQKKLTPYSEDELKTELVDALDFVLANRRALVVRRIATGALSLTSLTRIVCEVVLRKLTNLEGKTKESDGVYSFDLSPTVSSGDFWLPEKDRQVLDGADPGQQAVGTVSMSSDRGWGR